MAQSSEFLEKVIDSISERIVVIDEQGVIQFTNSAWDACGQKNACSIKNACSLKEGWCGLNYLSVCEQAGENDNDFGLKASAGISDVINGLEVFYLEYPCNGPDQKRWFMMTVKRLDYRQAKYLIISHVDITQRKQAEEHALNLSQVDGLTGLFNRRHFDTFFRHEWKRCARLGLPMTLAMIDVDHFKMLNDTYGHQYGDDCLIRLSQVIQKYAQRPSDICARYGGEEIVMAFGDATIQALLPVLNRLTEEIRALKFENRKSPVLPIVTVSIGVATMHPSPGSREETLLEKADRLLYKAKKGGRNRIEYEEVAFS